MTLQEAITRTKSEGGIDRTDAEVQVWILDRVRTMVADSMWRLQEASFGVTVAGTSRYAVPADVVDLKFIYIGTGRYDEISPWEMREVKTGRGSIVGDQGVYALVANSSSVEYIDFHPIPTQAGLAITGFSSMALGTVNLSDQLPIPADVHRYAVYGGIAEGLAVTDERLPEADAFEARFEQGVQKLTRRRMSRSGSGVQQIRVGGYHLTRR